MTARGWMRGGWGLGLALVVGCGGGEAEAPGSLLAEYRMVAPSESRVGGGEEPGATRQVLAVRSAGPGDGPAAVAHGPGGELFTLGHHRTPVDFGQGPLEAPGPMALTLTRHGPDGQLRWARLFPASVVRAQALAVAPRGHLLLTGWQGGGLALGSEPLPAGPFLARLDSEGHPLWARPLPAQATELAVDAAGAVTLAGVLPGEVDFGDGPVGAPGRPFLVRYTPAGALDWAHVEAERGVPMDLAHDDAGHLYLAGVRFLPSAPLPRPFLTRLSPRGQPGWTQVLEEAVGMAMSVTAHGDQVGVGGQLTGSLLFRGERLEAPRGRGFALAYGREGEERWGFLLGTSWPLVGAAPGVGVVLAGRYSGGEDFGLGLGPLPGYPGSTNLYVLRLHPAEGTLAWLRAFPTLSTFPVDLDATPRG
ncbi:MAG TPA: hypothetical protein VLQ93_21780, partial [Myxococcaceae bacterium]|nr:hypothetical protein [Myxococcaceae bacterium]